MRFRNFAFILICTFTAIKLQAYGSDVPIDLTLPEGNLTLQEAWKLALENNPQMEEVEQRIMAAQAQLKKAKTFLYPRISVDTGYQAINATDVLDWNPTMRVTENLNQFDIGVSLQWLVFDSMRSINYLKAAKQQMKAIEQQRLDAQRVLMQQVAGVYIQSQVAIENMRIAKSNCEFNQRLLGDAKAKYELGDVTEADMLNFSLGLSQAKTGFRNYRSEYEVTCAVIAQLLGYEDGALPHGKAPLVTDVSFLPNILDFKDAMSLAQEYRPDLKAVEIGLDAYEYQRKGIVAGGRPIVALVAGARYKKRYGSGPYEPEENDRNLGIVLSWDIFDGGARSADEENILAQRRELSAQMRRLKTNIATQIRKLLVDIKTTDEVLKEQELAQTDALTIRDNVEKAYDIGSTSITRLNEAQNGYIKVSGAVASIRLKQMHNYILLSSETGAILNMN